MEIKGLDQEKDHRLYKIVENVMAMYHFNNIKVKIKPKLKNAQASPFSGIFIGQPLLDTLNDDELEAVIAHEFGHIFRHDTLSAILTYLIFIAPFVLWVIFFNHSGSVSVGGSILFLITIVIWLYGIRIRNWIILNNEIMTDRQAVLLTKKPEALRRALIYLIGVPMISEKRPSLGSVIIDTIGSLVGYFFGFTHPYLKERIEELDFDERILKI
jgi:Zn-dependent protease with chaperone function